jgi:hypothetical protein
MEEDPVIFVQCDTNHGKPVPARYRMTIVRYTEIDANGNRKREMVVHADLCADCLGKIEAVSLDGETIEAVVVQ